MPKRVAFTLGPKKRKFTSIQEAADFFGVPYMTMYMRLRNGWTPVKAAKAKVRGYRKDGTEAPVVTETVVPEVQVETQPVTVDLPATEPVQEECRLYIAP